jgi:hypothetical protein
MILYPRVRIWIRSLTPTSGFRADYKVQELQAHLRGLTIKSCKNIDLLVYVFLDKDDDSQDFQFVTGIQIFTRVEDPSPPPPLFVC